MSWDFELTAKSGSHTSRGWWNYTCNVAPMVYDALEVAGYVLPPDTSPNGSGTISWWKAKVPSNHIQATPRQPREIPSHES